MLVEMDGSQTNSDAYQVGIGRSEQASRTLAAGINMLSQYLIVYEYGQY